MFPEFQDKNDEIHFFEELKHWGIPVKSGVKYHMHKQNMEGYGKVIADPTAISVKSGPTPQPPPMQAPQQ